MVNYIIKIILNRTSSELQMSQLYLHTGKLTRVILLRNFNWENFMIKAPGNTKGLSVLKILTRKIKDKRIY